MKEIYKIEGLNHIGDDLVYCYNRLTNKVTVEDYDEISDNRDIIILPYETDLVTFSEALNIYEDYIYNTTGKYLDFPRRGVSRYLRDIGYYDDFREFQNCIAKSRLIKWCYENDIYNIVA